jgi:hypothetical protein
VKKVRERCGADPHHNSLEGAKAIQGSTVVGIWKQVQNQKILCIVFFGDLELLFMVARGFGN